GQACQTHEKVRPRRQTCGSRRQCGQVLKLGREIGVIQEIVVNGAVEYHDPDKLIGLESVDDFLELPDHFRAHYVYRRVVNRDTPIGGRPPDQANLWIRKCARCRYHSILLSSCLVSETGWL